MKPEDGGASAAIHSTRKKPVPWWAVDLPLIGFLSAGGMFAFIKYTGMKPTGGMQFKMVFLSVVLGTAIGSLIRRILNAGRGVPQPEEPKTGNSAQP